MENWWENLRPGPRDAATPQARPEVPAEGRAGGERPDAPEGKGGPLAGVPEAVPEGLPGEPLTPERVRAHWQRTMDDTNEASSVRLKASELAARHLGMLDERVGLAVTVSPLSEATAGELVGLLAAVRAARLASAERPAERPALDVTPRAGEREPEEPSGG